MQGHNSRLRSWTAFEHLEERLALSTSPPVVTDVSVSSTQWDSAFIDYLSNNGLGESGYSVPVGSAAQTAPLAWDNIDQIRITFDVDVHVDAADLSLSGVSQTTYAFSDFNYYPEDRLAVWTLAAPLGKDAYQIDLNADGLDPVTDLAGNLLDGEWVNDSSTYASGDGVQGGDFEFRFNVLPGDAYGMGVLEYNDLYAIYYRVGLQTGDQGYMATADIDGDGIIENEDWAVVMNDWFGMVPTGDPAGTSNDAPTTSGLGYVEIDNAAIDVAISLYDAIDDAETPDAQLTFAVTSVSDPSLFDYVTINAQTGELVLNAAAYTSGRAEVVVEATDQTGLTVQSTLVVDVDRENLAPYLVLTVSQASGYSWIIEGWVFDSDEINLDDLYVMIDGQDFFRISVAEDGYFYISLWVEPFEGDAMTGYVYDSQGQVSNSVYFEIGWI